MWSAVFLAKNLWRSALKMCTQSRHVKHLHCDVVCGNVSPFSKLNTGNESELLCLLYSDWCGAFFFFTFAGFDVFVASFPFFSFFLPFQHTSLTHTVAIPVTHFNLHSLRWRFKAWSLLCAVIRQSEQLNCKARGMDALKERNKDRLSFCPSFLLWICVWLKRNIKTWPVAWDGYIRDNLDRSVKKMW